MKVGDLVMCTWQPRHKCGYTLKGQAGIVVKVDDARRGKILFPQYAAYTHWLAYGVVKVISESR